MTDIDGNVYNTVQIDYQCWMRENLRTTQYSDGTPIPAGGDNLSDTDPYYYDYSSSDIPLSERGYLYNWPAVMHGKSSSNSVPSEVRGVCPTGWHVPSDPEFVVLTDYQSSRPEYICGGETTNIAKALASTTLVGGEPRLLYMQSKRPECECQQRFWFQRHSRRMVLDGRA